MSIIPSKATSTPSKLNSEMTNLIKYVIKRDGKPEPMSEDKIFYRIKKLIDNSVLGPLKNVSALNVSRDVDDFCIDGVTTTQLDIEAAKICNGKRLTHNLEYGTLAARLTVSNLHKNTTECFSSVMESLFINKDSQGNNQCILSERFIKTVRKYKDILNEKIDYTRDYTHADYFGLKVLEGAYLLKKHSGKMSGKIENKVVAERIQHALMRIAIELYGGSGDDLESILKCYDLMSMKYFTHASPTIFNAGTTKPQLASCFLVDMDDSMESIGKTISNALTISASSGGIGLAYRLRATGTSIKGSNGVASGFIKPAKIFEAAMVYADQGGKRPGSMSIFMEPWHADVFEFLDSPKNTGDHNKRAPKLFYSMWIPDNFMQAVSTNGKYYLMCPKECPGLSNSHGEAFEELYNEYVKKGLYRKEIDARDLFMQICRSQMETGMPYIGYKDHVNKKTNQMNLGTQVCSNLCIEINIFSSPTEYGTCNLSTLSLPKFVETNSKGVPVYNFKKLYDVTKFLTRNMNKVIDNNYYPVPETKISNNRHRPIGIGAQGLANTFFEMGLPFESIEARKLNKDIYETIQFAALESSNDIARELTMLNPDGSIKEHGWYSSFPGSPASKGLFQHNLWGVQNDDPSNISGMWDWNELKLKVIKYGLRNSLVTASPPTASTSQILGNYESFEPIHSNIFERSVKAGEFTIVNEYLVKDLMKLNLWDTTMYQKIKTNSGSVQDIPEIPQRLKDLYKTVFEIRQMTLMDMSADRGLFTDQSQSLNLYVSNPSADKLSSLHMYSWKKGLKTGMYYLRMKTKAVVQKYNSGGMSSSSIVPYQITPSGLEHTMTDTLNLFKGASFSSTTIDAPGTAPIEAPEESSVPLFCTINNPECSSCGS